MANLITAKNAGLGSLIVIPAVTAGVFLFNKPAPSPAYAVCLTTPIAFADGEAAGCLTPDRIPALMTRPVTLGDNAEITGVELTSTSGNQTREVRTCQEYDSAVGEGMFALSTADMSAESFFKRACGILKAIASARPAQRSYLSSPHVSLADLNLVSANAVSLIVEAPGPARTVSDLVSAGTVKVERTSDNALQISTPAMAGELKELARADFNGDGLEDMLVFQAVHAEGGTLRAYDTEILTRRTADGPLEVTR